MTKKCMGCGVPLQSEEKEKLGYTPDIKKNYCMRCFRLKHYGEKKNHDSIFDEAILNKVNHSHGIAFFFVDYLNINIYTISLFQRIKIKKVLVISKVDTLRKDMKFLKIKKWLKKVYSIMDDVFFVSTKKQYGIHSIFDYLEQEDNKVAYIMGITNAGKSTYLNQILKENNMRREIVVSKEPNTTLDFIPLSIGNYTFIDTPGFSYPHMSNEFITKEMKPITYRLKKNTTIHIKDYSICFLNDTSVTCYLSIPKILKRSYQKIEGEKVYLKENQDLVFVGYGFLNVKKAGDILLSNSSIEIRDSISGV